MTPEQRCHRLLQQWEILKEDDPLAWIPHPKWEDSIAIATDYLELVKKIKTLREACRVACEELGVPNFNYPMPVAYAHTVAKNALRDTE